MAYSFHFGTTIGALTDFSGAAYNLTVVSDDNPLIPEFDIGVYSNPQAHKQGMYTGTATERVFEIPCVIRAASAATLRTQLDSTFGALGLGLSSGYLKLDTWPTRIWYGRFVGRSGEKRHGANNMLFTLTFRCEDMFAYATSLTTQTITISSDPQTFMVPATSGTVVAGNVDPTPVWVIKNTSGGDEYGLILANATTGETINISGLADAYWLKLDFDRQVVELSTDSGSTWAAYMTAVGTNANIPALSHSTQNSITLTGLSAGSVVLTYYARYL